MTYPNPHYDPKWKEIHDRHAAERQLLEKETTRLAENGEIGSEAYQEAKAAFHYHHKACLKSFTMQHATVQEYAEWLFRNFRVDSGDWEGGIPVPTVDFSQLRTIEEADAAWSRVHQIVSDAAGERRNSLPTGQPDDLQAFADAASPALSRYWREFEPHDLFPNGYGEDARTRTLMTVDEQEDGWHICFMQDGKSTGISVTNAIERLATAVYREACTLAEQSLPAPSGWQRWLPGGRAARVKAATPLPSQFHFYQHIPPEGELGQEEFDRVDLKFSDGQFRDPDWVGYDVVPQAIQSARFDIALDATAPGHLSLKGPESR